MKKLIIILGVLGASFSAILVRTSSAPSMVLVLYRVLIASIILFPAAILWHRDEWKRLPKKMLALSMISGMFLGLHFTAYFESLKYTSIASSVVLVNTEVFFVAFSMLIIFKEKISAKGWMGILAAFVGSIIIASADAGDGSNILMGDALSLLGAALMAVYTLIGKACRKEMTTTVYTFIVYMSASITVLVLLIIGRVPITGYDSRNYLIALGLAVFCTLLGHSVFSWGLKYEKASFISTAKLLEPVFSSVLGIIIFAEIPPAMVITGGSVVIFGIYYYSRHSE